MRISFLTLLFLCVLTQAPAQQVKYNGIISVGAVAGETGPTLQLQTIGGLHYKTWSAGIGLGLDYYFIRSLPIFIDVRKKLRAKTKTAFVYADVGYNSPWLSKEDKQGFTISARGGLYYDAGIGYQLPVLKGRSLFFSAGYTGKYLVTTEALPYYLDYIAPGQTPTSANARSYHYTLQRLSFKIGLGF